MNPNNHELCRRILSDISCLRKDLRELEELESSLFEGYDPTIQSRWEFWSTDDILEIISDDIKGILLENNIPTQIVGNTDILKDNNG